MLVLKRNQNEKVVIGTTFGPIEVLVVEVAHGWVKLGFKADPAIPIHRHEIWLRMQNELENQQTPKRRPTELPT